MVILGMNTFHGDSSAATACGMHLITAKTVGASIDLVRSGVNGIELSKLNSNELVNVFNYYEKLDEDLLRNGSKVSRGIAEDFDSYSYYSSIKRLLILVGEKTKFKVLDN